MIKRIILVVVVIFTGCSQETSSESKNNALKASCLIEEVETGDLIMCFEGSKDYVKRKCIQPKKDTILKPPRVIYSEKNCCPKNRGYFGYCILDNGEYIPFSYADPQIFHDKKGVDIAIKEESKDCKDINGIWVGKDSK